ncbi:MAG TPA: hypothetical protein VG122_19900 [Gemmata sp.]|jgi:hypothetical protein|nr:hypothetical protein [Gemmata sp.]
MGIFVPPNYKATKTVPAVPGLHPELKIVYKLMSAKDRSMRQNKLSQSKQADVHEALDLNLINAHLVSINGMNNSAFASGLWLITPQMVTELRPAVRRILVDLILGETHEDPGPANQLDVQPPEPPPTITVNCASGSTSFAVSPGPRGV